MAKRLAKKVLLIGWDAADWKVIHPLLDKREMPALEGLINNGVMGNIATLDPPLSPMLWTSIATGKRADKHGILGFTEPDQATGGVRPVLSTSRKAKAIWNILSQHQLKTHVIGWWPSHPAEPINGICVSNLYQRANAPIDKPWPMLPGTVHPKNKSRIFTALRIHPDELTEAHMLPFVPNAAKVDQEKDKRLGVLSKILADCATIHSAATWTMENEDWDFMAVYYDAIDHFCHAFMKFHPPRLPNVPEDLFETYKEVITGAYRFHDMMLERLLKLAGEDTTVILVSDHGFHSDHLRPLSLPKEPAAPALEHREYGIICAKGSGIKKDQRIYGSSLLDIAPTVLQLFGLPVGTDMDGKPLVQIFDHDIKIETIPSWELIEGNSGMHPPHANQDASVGQEALDQLVELGYVEKPDDNKQKALQTTLTEAQYNLARVHIEANNFKKALPILEILFKENPKQARFGLRLAHCLQQTGNLKKSRKVIDSLRKGSAKKTPQLDFIEGILLLNENRPKQALNYFNKVKGKMMPTPNLYLEIGKAHQKLKQWDKAEAALKGALSIDADNANAFYLLGISYLRTNKYYEAADSLLNAIGLRYHFPLAHYYLGQTLMHIQDYQKAAQAFEVSISMVPNLIKARHSLVDLYENQLKQAEKATVHRSFIEKLNEDPIIVVSGLPRSGTSMMMQMLKAGGVKIYSDAVRKPDDNNPKGYYEHENVKSLKRNKKWLSETKGKAVKIISHLLNHLPPRFKYKIIFMNRDIDEVILSQQKMLNKDTKNYPMSLSNAYKRNLENIKIWATNTPNIDILYVDYAGIISNPTVEIKRINEFFNDHLDSNKMEKAINPNLYHTRKSVEVKS